MAKLNVNGVPHSVEVPDNKPLLWVLRENLNLRGAKYGCGKGLCGACTVMIDGRAVRSCVMAVSAVGDQAVITIEGLDDPLGVALKTTWCRLRVAQCGYCQTGQILAAHDLISSRAQDEPLAVKEKLTNLCRCGTYNRIHEAVEAVAEEVKGGE